MSDEEKIASSIEDSDHSNGRDPIKPKPVKKTKPSTKSKDLRVKLEAAEQENGALKDRLLRTAAEFENYRKRRESEYAQLITNANAELFAQLLPIFDDLERSVQSLGETQAGDGVFQGIELIYKNFKKILENYGVEPIEAVGKEFDPEQHDALMQVESKEHPPGMVVDEHLRGYVMNGRVLRHSQVLVSK